jgi:hypothetical protein
MKINHCVYFNRQPLQAATPAEAANPPPAEVTIQTPREVPLVSATGRLGL